MFQIALCDDDLEFLNTFKYLLSEAFSSLNQKVTLTIFDDGRMLIDAIEKQGQIYDVIFLDVEMPIISGFQTAHRLRQLKSGFVLIFTTFLESQVREGYKYDAYRYIFKNNLHAEVSEAVSSIISKLQTQSSDDELVTLKHRNLGVLETVEVKKSDILYFRLEKTRRVTLTTIYSEYELLTKPLSEYQQQMQNNSFCLVMRNYLLNFNRIVDINRDSFIMEDGETIPLGMTRETQKASKEKYMQFVKERL